ncbi:MAG: ferritin-like domain-containing protein [Nanoarchaeota archaeon]|nr:ferritin-like domain-containing protein [Nanoarchaeota archaeon]MBU1623362.1 ferritin-like domain-containing protein [Nanoarchaeota archaeon]MBU1973960.1 ferritin-like domain-containing protein [Nanoarchaeota archaeon]
MVKLWRCEICGDPYVGDEAPSNCPFCGAKKENIKEAIEAEANFDVQLNEKDKANVEKALQLELSNVAFYGCAEKKTNDEEGKQLFKALRKVEAEHASIWKKILKLKELPEVKEPCHEENQENLKESHQRETRAIEFYKQAANEAENERLKRLFEVIVEVENDHLKLSEVRLT